MSVIPLVVQWCNWGNHKDERRNFKCFIHEERSEQSCAKQFLELQSNSILSEEGPANSLEIWFYHKY